MYKKLIKQFIICLLILLTLELPGCLEPFSKEIVRYRGRIVQGYNSNLPIEGVLVVGCTTDITLFPNSPSSCDAETYTDGTGSFDLKFEADKLQGKHIAYSKEGYLSLDSCKTLQDGSLECYMRQLPTIFYIYSSFKDKIPFKYDSLVVNIESIAKDTTVHYWTSFFINTSSDTSYYWRTINSQIDSPFMSQTYTEVPDDSYVKVKARYFKNKTFEMIDSAAFFCAKGVGNTYQILDK